MDNSLKLEPQDIRKYWDEIKPGLEDIKATWPELSTWRVEDVYAAVVAEEAILYVKEEGFAVCTLETDEFSGKTDLSIWIAYSYGTEKHMIQKYLTSFIEVAKRLGCSGVSTRSNHPALAKALEPTYVKYRVPVDGS